MQRNHFYLFEEDDVDVDVDVDVDEILFVEFFDAA